MTIKFAYWATNLGGLVTSTVPQKTGSSFDDNKRYAQIAEKVGFDYTLIATRFLAGYSANSQLDSIALSSALAAVTEKLNLITAVLSGVWNPATVAKAISTIDNISQGRSAINMLSGWFKDEFIAMGEPWLDHDERYRRTTEFVEVLKGVPPTKRGKHTLSKFRHDKSRFFLR